MRKTMLLLFLMINLTAIYSSDAFKISKVIQADSMSKDEIYVKIREWVSTNYNDSKEVIQMDDKEAGMIICMANYEYSYNSLQYKSYDGWIKYSLKISIKDGRLKVDVSNFVHNNRPGYQDKSNLGLITDAENYAESGIQKKFHNNVWKDIKIKSQVKAGVIFKKIEDKLANQETEDDW